MPTPRPYKESFIYPTMEYVYNNLKHFCLDGGFFLSEREKRPIHFFPLPSNLQRRTRLTWTAGYIILTRNYLWTFNHLHKD